jgi:hypothetical protein
MFNAPGRMVLAKSQINISKKDVNSNINDDSSNLWVLLPPVHEIRPWTLARNIESMKVDITAHSICKQCGARFPNSWFKKGTAFDGLCSKLCKDTNEAKEQQRLVRQGENTSQGGSFHQSETPFTP